MEAQRVQKEVWDNIKTCKGIWLLEETSRNMIILERIRKGDKELQKLQYSASTEAVPYIWQGIWQLQQNKPFQGSM